MGDALSSTYALTGKYNPGRIPPEVKPKGIVNDTAHNRKIMTREEFYGMVEKAKGGDEEAFRALIENKLKMIMLQSMNILGNAQDAEDAAQEIILTVYNYIAKLRDPYVFNAWLNRIIINTCNTILGKRVRRNEHLGADEFYVTIEDEDADVIPANSLEGKEDRASLRRVIDSLPARRRDAIKMYYFDEMSYTEIARVMDVTVSAVSTYILKGKRQIKRKYEKSHPSAQEDARTKKAASDLPPVPKAIESRPAAQNAVPETEESQ
ncbi:MAG: RNA polymerase sigma factor [Clostridiales Family XIII bacterium]|nr:RNA polymerase sigma factor [Clostridiales Family XIII bacterium]